MSKFLCDDCDLMIGTYHPKYVTEKGDEYRINHEYAICPKRGVIRKIGKDGRCNDRVKRKG